MKINKIIFGVAFLLTVAINAQVSVIANKSVAENSISNTTVKDIYSLDIQQWENGNSIKVFDLKPDNAVKSKFYNYISAKQSNFKKVWLRAKLSGEGNPPKLLGSDEEVLNNVTSTPNSIGYISSSKVTDAVKVLATIN